MKDVKDTLFLEMTAQDVRLVIRALNRLEREAKGALIRNSEKGWQPEPGKNDVHRYLIDRVESFRNKLLVQAIQDLGPEWQNA